MFAIFNTARVIIGHVLVFTTSYTHITVRNRQWTNPPAYAINCYWLTLKRRYNSDWLCALRKKGGRKAAVGCDRKLGLGMDNILANVALLFSILRY